MPPTKRCSELQLEPDDSDVFCSFREGDGENGDPAEAANKLMGRPTSEQNQNI